MSPSQTFSEKLVDLLSVTEYSLNVKPNKFSSLQNNKHLQPLLDWFISNFSKENCVSFGTLQEFEKLKKDNDVLYGSELEESLQEYNGGSGGVAVVDLSSHSKAAHSQLTHLGTALQTKTLLLEQQRLSNSEMVEELHDVQNQIKESEERHNEALSIVSGLNKVYCNKILQIKKELCNIQERLEHNVEAAVDEGYMSNTLMSDKLSESTVSTSSGCSIKTCYSDKGFSDMLICQLSLTDYEKSNKKLKRLIEVLHQAEMLKFETNEEEVELQFLRERLCRQKEEIIKKCVEMEALKQANTLILEVCKIPHHKLSIPLLRAEFFDLENAEEDLHEARRRVAELCEDWAEARLYEPVVDKLREKIESMKHATTKVEGMVEALKLKLVADSTLCRLLVFDEECVLASIGFHTSVQNMFLEKNIKLSARLSLMGENLKEYNAFCSSHIEESCGLLTCLSHLLGCEVEAVVQAVTTLSQYVNQQHNTLVDHNYHQMLTVVRVRRDLKDLFFSLKKTDSSSHYSGPTHQRFLSIHASLRDMTDCISQLKTQINKLFVSN